MKTNVKYMNIRSGTISWINPWYNCSLYIWNSFSKTLFIKKWKKWFLQSYLSPLMLSVRISIRARCTTLCDKVCQWLTTGQWFSFQFFFPSDWLIELLLFKVSMSATFLTRTRLQTMKWFYWKIRMPQQQMVLLED